MLLFVGPLLMSRCSPSLKTAGSSTVSSISDSLVPLKILDLPSPEDVTVGEVVVNRTISDSLDIAAIDSVRNGIDSTMTNVIDSLSTASSDTISRTGVERDSIGRKPFLDDVISTQNQDSLIYKVKEKLVYLYEKGDVKYQDKDLKADFMRINMQNREVFAYGRVDTTEKKTTRPEFLDGPNTYTMDTINYNFTTEKASIKGVATKDGEGFLLGEKVKKMPDNTINIAHGKYTTCDAEEPHFYIAMTKAKTIPNKKVIMGASYIVMEDVPIYFLGLPFGFFPMMTDRNSGFIMPEYGEEVVKGFFIRNGGYYLAFNDYVDASITAGVYTLGSWEANVTSRYTKRYKFRGSLSARFSKDIIGEKGAKDYVNQNNFNVNWSHQQDPKFKPSSTFSASVNFSTSGYSKYGSQTMNDYLTSQTNSSISYSKTWVGTPFSLSTNLQHSQNSRDTTVSLSFPNVVFNVARIFPFRRKEAVGKQRWYEKIALNYTGTLGNNVMVKERDLFTDKMFSEMKNGVNHVIPISTSLNIFNFINVSPSVNYQERWYFKKIEKTWDPVLGQAVDSDTTSGFYRVYNYSASAGMSTKIYGDYVFKKQNGPIRAIRHMLTPSISASYTPNFGDPKYGFYKQVQSDADGNMMTYSPFQNGMYGVPSSGQSASMSFSLQQTLEIKVRSKSDTSGVKKIKLIDNLGLSSSYNFLADSLNLSPISINFRTNLIKNFGINLTATLDPYEVNSKGQRINKFMLENGKLGRISNASTSFGYSFNSSKQAGTRTVSNDINSTTAPPPDAYTDIFSQPGYNDVDPNTRRQMMSSQYYDFDIPWNIGFNYSISYSNNGVRKNITQTLGFNGSVTLTEKLGFTFNGGYDFEARKITPGTFSLTRDLHCWQMSFNWVPIGFRKSWSFSIGVKSGMLKDLKYDRNSSFYDNLLD